MKNKPVESYPNRNHVDGNNVSKVSQNPRPLEVERGHDFWTDEKTGKRIDKPEYARDDD